MARVIAAILLASIPCSFAHAQGRLYVDIDAPAGGNGASWSTAYTQLQTALFHALNASGTIVEIWVAEGTYIPDPVTLNRATSFVLQNGLALYGGFAGSETTLEERDWILHATVLSGDLLGDDGPHFTNRSENTLHVLQAPNLGPTAVLDGFIVERGFADGLSGTGSDWGGGMLVVNANPLVRNCRFRENLVKSLGAAAYLHEGLVIGAEFEDCIFENNLSLKYGGAVHVFHATPVFTRCTFTLNEADQGGAINARNISGIRRTTVRESVFVQNKALLGGAISALKMHLLIEDCVFIDNVDRDGAGAIHSSNGEFILVRSSIDGNSSWMNGNGGVQASAATWRAEVRECTFTDNAGSGGALMISGAPVLLIATDFYGNSSQHDAGAVQFAGGQSIQVVNCRFGGNTAFNRGGAVFAINDPLFANCLFHSNQSGASGGAFIGNTGRFVQCTFADNRAATGQGGAIHANHNSGVVDIDNSIFWGNEDGYAVGEDAQIYIHSSGVAVAVDHSLVEGWTGNLGGVGNTGQAPAFADPSGPDLLPGTTDDDYRLAAGSPAIDAGDKRQLPQDAWDLDGDGDLNEPVPIDLGGRPRVLDDPAAPDVGPGPPPVVDMGAFERPCDEPVTYCTAKTNSCGTAAAIAASGVASASASSGFTVDALGARPGKFGLLVYSNQGRRIPAAPFEGGLLCINTPVRRAVPTASTGGTSGSCDGRFSIDMNAFAVGALGGNPQAFLALPGTQIECQWWGRDTIAHGSLVTDALEYRICP